MNKDNKNATNGDLTPDSHLTENKRKYHKYIMSYDKGIDTINVNDKGHWLNLAAHDNALDKNKHRSNLVKGGIVLLVCIR